MVPTVFNVEAAMYQVTDGLTVADKPQAALKAARIV